MTDNFDRKYAELQMDLDEGLITERDFNRQVLVLLKQTAEENQATAERVHETGMDR